MKVRRAVVIAWIVATGFLATDAVVVSASVDPLSSKNAKPLTQAQFVSRANALCTSAVTQFAAVQQQFASIKSNPTPSEISAFINALIPIVQQQINKTKALNPPKADRAKVATLLREDQLDLNRVKTNPQLLGGKTDPSLDADTLARRLGLAGAPGSGACSKGGGATSGGG